MATLTRSPAEQTDDGQCREDGSAYTTLGSHQMGIYASTQKYAQYERFPNITIANSATINSASIRFYAGAGSAGSPALKLYANDADNPTYPVDAAGLLGLTLTTAYADWSPGAWTDTLPYDTPDLKDIVQEIVNRAGWVSGNALMFVVRWAGSGTFQNRVARTWVASPATYYPVLTVSYSNPALGGSGGGLQRYVSQVPIHGLVRR